MNKIKPNFDRRSRRTLTTMSNRRFKLEWGLYPSSATLIIVPQELLEHWREQILMHVDLRYFSSDYNCERGVVYFYGIGDIMDFRGQPYNSKNHRAEDSLQASDLANYSIVVTTLELCAAEFTKHCNEAASKRRDSESKRSPLHSIRWLRLIVDEGHDIGRSNTKDNSGRSQKHTPKIQKHKRKAAKNHLKQLSEASDFILEIAAERRWIMSGTPTTGAHSDIGLEQLFHLLCFLRHPYCVSSDGSQGKEEKWEEWKNEIIDPCLEQHPSAWEHLSKMLKSLMIRHSKASNFLDITLYYVVSRFAWFLLM